MSSDNIDAPKAESDARYGVVVEVSDFLAWLASLPQTPPNEETDTHSG